MEDKAENRIELLKQLIALREKRSVLLSLVKALSELHELNRALQERNK